MRRAGNTYLFCHRTFPPGGGGLPGPAVQRGLTAQLNLAARFDGDGRDRKDRECAEWMTGETLACPWPRGSAPGGAASRGGQPIQLAERAVWIGDPNAEILWTPKPMPTRESTSAGPFEPSCARSAASQPHRRTARFEREWGYIRLSRAGCTLLAANGGPVSACS